MTTLIKQFSQKEVLKLEQERIAEENLIIKSLINNREAMKKELIPFNAALDIEKQIIEYDILSLFKKYMYYFDKSKVKLFLDKIQNELRFSLNGFQKSLLFFEDYQKGKIYTYKGLKSNLVSIFNFFNITDFKHEFYFAKEVYVRLVNQYRDDNNQLETEYVLVIFLDEETGVIIRAVDSEDFCRLYYIKSMYTNSSVKRIFSDSDIKEVNKIDIPKAGFIEALDIYNAGNYKAGMRNLGCFIYDDSWSITR